MKKYFPLLLCTLLLQEPTVQASSWNTFHGNASHNGYFKTNLDYSTFNVRWIKDLGITSSIVIEQQSFYANNGSSLKSVDVIDGSINWEYFFPDIYHSISPPSVYNNAVFIQTISDHSNARLWKLNAQNREILFKNDFSAQSYNYPMPTPFADSIYINAGSSSGIHSFDTINGSNSWLTQLSSYSQSIPSVDDKHVYVLTGGILNILDRLSGQIITSITDPNYNYGSNNIIKQAPALGNEGLLYVTNAGRLLCYDTIANEIKWELNDKFSGQTSVDEQYVYAINDGILTALNAKTGEKIFDSAFLEDKFYGSVIVTDNLIFASNSLTTIAFNKNSFSEVWRYPAGGDLALDSNGALFIITSTGQVHVINTSGDTDSDDIPDWWEYLYELDPNDKADGVSDKDNDGLTALQEYTASTNPLLNDSDQDGLNDKEELDIHSDPNKPDTDNDGLTDIQETEIGSNPFLPDTDNDGVYDGDEVKAGLSPLDANDALSDTDEDGFNNIVEYYAGSDMNSNLSKPSIHNWSMIQGNAKHTGYVPLWLDSSHFKVRWSKQIEGLNAKEISYGNMQLYISSTDKDIYAIDALNGKTNWKNTYPAITLRPPSFNDGRIIVRSESTLWNVASNTGNVINNIELNSQGQYYNAPTITDTGIAIVNSGHSSGGVSSINTVTGEILWQQNGSSEDSWEPAVDVHHAYIPSGTGISILDRTSGEILSHIQEEYYNARTLVIGNHNNILARIGMLPFQLIQLISYDIDSGAVNWSKEGRLTNMPAVGNNRVFAIINGQLQVFQEETGELLWEWSQEPLESNVVVTASHVFVSSASTIYALNVYSGDPEWSYNTGASHLILSGGALFALSPFNLLALDIEGDIDSDSLPDWWERMYQLHPNNADDSTSDFDNDGLTALEEFQAKSNPLLNDSDNDGLNDKAELDLGTDPNKSDTDNDGLDDQLEIEIGTNPLQADTDGDGFNDGEEINSGFSPLDSKDILDDTDNDGHKNIVEYYAGSDMYSNQSKPIITNWSMVQGNSKHSGYVPLWLDSAHFKLRWTKNINNVNTLEMAYGNNQLYVTTKVEPTLHAINPLNGITNWSTQLDAGTFSPPSFYKNEIFVHGGEYGQVALWSFNAENGVQTAKVPLSAQSSNYNAPTISEDGQAIINGGYYGGFRSVDTTKDILLWQQDGVWEDYWEPAIDAHNTYVPSDTGLKIIDRTSGETLYNIEGQNSTSTPIIGSHNNVLTVSNSAYGLTSYNLEHKIVNWKIPEKVNNLPTIGNNRIYAIVNFSLKVFNEQTGELLWTWGGHGLESNIILTTSHVFVANKTNIFALNAFSGKLEWSYPQGAKHLILSDNTLFLSTDSTVIAFNLIQDTIKRTRYDQDGDGTADIIWRNEVSGQNWYYNIEQASISKTLPINTVYSPWFIAGRGDFNGDGRGDLLWRNKSTGVNYIYLMDDNKIISSQAISTVPQDSGWVVASIGDYNGDNRDDILWQNQLDGRIWQYQMDGLNIKTSQLIKTITDKNWSIVGSHDLNGDGKSDILLRNTATGTLWKYIMDGLHISESEKLMSAGLEWQLIAVGDFDANGNEDLFWRNDQDGRNYVYLLNKGTLSQAQSAQISQFSDQNWRAVMIADFDGDGDDDIFWRHAKSGKNYLYLMNGLNFIGHTLNQVSDLDWNPVK